MTDTPAETFPRPLTAREAELVRWLLAPGRGVPTAAAAKWDVPALQVVGRCGCGCASVDFSAAGTDRGMNGYRDWYFRDAAGNLYAAFLFDRGDLPGGLDLYALAAPNVPRTPPDPADLRETV